jgi:hypothetical protein
MESRYTDTPGPRSIVLVAKRNSFCKHCRRDTAHYVSNRKCVACDRERARKWRRENTERARIVRRERKYRITAAQFDEMLRAQKGAMRHLSKAHRCTVSACRPLSHDGTQSRAALPEL